MSPAQGLVRCITGKDGVCRGGKTGGGESAEIAPIKAVGRRVQQEQFVCPNAVTALPAWQRPTHSVVRFGYGDTVAVHRDDSAGAARPLPGQSRSMFHERHADWIGRTTSYPIGSSSEFEEACHQEPHADAHSATG